MKHLSVNWSGWLAGRAGEPAPIEFDVLVIGSGYGAAVAALRLAERGRKVTLLERGSEYRPGDFPNDLGVAPKHFRAPSPDGRAITGRATGLYELRAGPGVISMLGNGLGGGSLINAGVVLQPDDDVFAQAAWPAELRSDAGGLAAHFKTARAMLRAHSALPMAGLRKARAFDALGAGLVPPRSGQAVDFTIDPARCIRCGDCASGCNVAGAKLTLRDTYLRHACDAGAMLFNSATVYSIARLAEGGWRVRVLPTESIARFRSVREAAHLGADAGVGVDVQAALVVIAAGTFGSTELLQRSKALEGARRRAPVAFAGARLALVGQR